MIAVPPSFHLELTLQALSGGQACAGGEPAYLRMEDYEAVRQARDRAQRVVLVGENDTTSRSLSVSAASWRTA